MTPSEIRLRLFHAGFQPLPLRGKNPDVNGKGWQQKRLATSPDEIALWERVYPDANNTGVLCRNTPFLDLDILDPAAAQAAEELVAERFDGCYVLSRIGHWPKRAIPFQTETPFTKINVTLVAGNGSEQKIEFLGDGQQVVVSGIHPDTNKPYEWHGGELGAVPRDDLPGIDAAQALDLVNAVVELLERDFGYHRKADPKPAGKPADGPTDWPTFDELIDHDKLAAFAMKLLVSGMGDGAAVNFLRKAVSGLRDVDEERRQRRLKEIPSIVSSAREEIRKAAQPPPPPPKPTKLDEVIAVFNKWLVLKDATPIYAVLGTVAANLLPGDPVWLGIIAPPSSAKTEILNALSRLPNVEPTATLTPAGLLSGTPKRQTAAAPRAGCCARSASSAFWS